MLSIAVVQQGRSRYSASTATYTMMNLTQFSYNNNGNNNINFVYIHYIRECRRVTQSIQKFQIFEFIQFSADMFSFFVWCRVSHRTYLKLTPMLSFYFSLTFFRWRLEDWIFRTWSTWSTSICLATSRNTFTALVVRVASATSVNDSGLLFTRD